MASVDKGRNNLRHEIDIAQMEAMAAEHLKVSYLDIFPCTAFRSKVVY